MTMRSAHCKASSWAIGFRVGEASHRDVAKRLSGSDGSAFAGSHRKLSRKKQRALGSA